MSDAPLGRDTSAVPGPVPAADFQAALSGTADTAAPAAAPPEARPGADARATSPDPAAAPDALPDASAPPPHRADLHSLVTGGTAAETAPVEPALDRPGKPALAGAAIAGLLLVVAPFAFVAGTQELTLQSVPIAAGGLPGQNAAQGSGSETAGTSTEGTGAEGAGGGSSGSGTTDAGAGSATGATGGQGGQETGYIPEALPREADAAAPPATGEGAADTGTGTETSGASGDTAGAAAPDRSGRPEEAGADSGAEARGDAESAADAGSGTDSGSGADAGTGVETDTDADADADTGTSADTNTGTDADANAAAGDDTDTVPETGNGAGTGTDGQTDESPAAEQGAQEGTRQGGEEGGPSTGESATAPTGQEGTMAAGVGADPEADTGGGSILEDATAATGTADRAPFSALAGPGCLASPGASYDRVNRWDSAEGTASWATRQGGYAQEGCDGGYEAIPVSGSPDHGDGQYAFWSFSPGYPDAACEIYVHVPDDESPLWVTGTEAVYQIFSGSAPEGDAIAVFGVTQAEVRGAWVQVTGFTSPTEEFTVQLTNVGADPLADQDHTSAHVAASAVRTTCS